MSQHPVHIDVCEDCGGHHELAAGESRCPACFQRYLYDIDAGFLESYRRFGGRSHLVVAETCLRALVLDTPEHRKVLAMTIFEQYIQAMTGLAGIFNSILQRDQAPILQSFMRFKLDAASAVAFFRTIDSLSDAELYAAMGLPMSHEVARSCPHLNSEDSYQLQVALHHLVIDLRQATQQGDTAALALAQVNAGLAGAVISDDARWLNESVVRVTPDQVAMLVLDLKRRLIHVQGISAGEEEMARVVGSIDTATRATSNLIFAYLQSHNL